MYLDKNNDDMSEMSLEELMNMTVTVAIDNPLESSEYNYHTKLEVNISSW